MFRKTDYILLSVICCILGIALMAQFYSSKSSKSILQPENNDVLAVEIERIAKTNSALKVKVADLTDEYNDYSSKNTSENNYAKYRADIIELDKIIGVTEISGQGVEVGIVGQLTTAQLVDVVNAIKNIGSEVIAINGKRITLTTYLDSANFSSPYKIFALGNSSLLESALTRKGGIIEQIKDKNINISVEKRDFVSVPSSNMPIFTNAKILDK